MSGLGVIDYGESPCFSGTRLLLKNPCTGGTIDLLQTEIDLEPHLCELVFLDGYDPFYLTGICPTGVIDPVLVEPAEAPCRVQVRELALEPAPDGLHLAWAELPCTDDYDVVRGFLWNLSEGDLGAVECIADDTATTEAVDTTGEDPSPGEGYFYAVRARGAVGSAHYGHSSLGTTRSPAMGDCPPE
jgi:hypothetical protein